jgi:manganese-dependent inorganic pyrophosphatase
MIKKVKKSAITPALVIPRIHLYSILMEMVYVTGHRNPDMDSVCAAHCYAALKNAVDPDTRYQPIRCGAMNAQTRYVFEQLGIEAPSLVRDVYPKVADVAKRDIITLNVTDPVYTAIRELDERTLSMIPVFENMQQFRGLVSIHEISSFLISDNLHTRPVYRFLTDNFKRVVPGYFYRMGQVQEFSAPIMIGAMPYEISIQRIRELGDVKPILIVGLREELVAYAIENEFPAIILTGLDEDRSISIDFSSYSGTVYVSRADTAETVRLLRLSAPLKDIMNASPLAVQSSEKYETAKERLVNSEYRGLPVFEGDQFSGIVTRRCFIEKPQRRLILVDHNEINQSVPGAAEAQIIEIVDHHRLAFERTREPITMKMEPAGSTCTIIYHEYRYHGVPIDRQTATLLLGGILADTVMLKSPTTTGAERAAVEELGRLAEVDWQAWGKDLFIHSASIRNRRPREVLESDFKEYDEAGIRIGIGQAEVVTLEDLPEVRDELIRALGEVRLERGLEWVMLLVSDVMKAESVLLSVGLEAAGAMLIYEKRSENEFFLPGILSRKKQLLPEILRVVDEVAASSP